MANDTQTTSYQPPQTPIKEINLSTWVGIVVNIFLTIFKIIAGIVGRSQAVLADGIESLMDIGTSSVIIVGVRYWSKPPDESHPHGHRRIETLISLFIGVVLFIVASSIIFRAIVTMRQQHTEPPGSIAIAGALTSIIFKELLYHWTIRIGKRIKSSAVIANAWHHRSDAFSSIPTLLAVVGARLLPGWYFLDHLGAIIATMFIYQSGGRIIWAALRELSDAAAGNDVFAEIKDLSLSVNGVKNIHKVRTRQLGAGIEVDLHVQVDKNLTVEEGHLIAAQVKYKLLQDGPEIIDVIVHIEPYFPESNQS
jgi:cation diffusion facilitator family transporter